MVNGQRSIVICHRRYLHFLPRAKSYYQAVFEVSNPSEVLRIGMQANLRLDAGSREIVACLVEAAVYWRLSPSNGGCIVVVQEPFVKRTIPGYQWIVRDSEKFGGKPTIQGTRFTVSFILGCLSEGMTHEEIVRDYSDFPRESLPEILRFASEVTDNPDVAA